MKKPNGIPESLLIMVSEVSAQVDQTRRFFASPSRSLGEEINVRDDYIDNLKGSIEDHAFERIRAELADKDQVNLLRSVATVAVNLERIADFAVNILRQCEHFHDARYLGRYPYQPFFHEVQAGLASVVSALEKRDLALAYDICQREANLDQLYRQQFARVLADLATGESPGDLVTYLFIFHYLERMGDSLLNIGEAIIFALVGEKLKIGQYRALDEGIAASGLGNGLSEMEIKSIWGTRSGHRIGTARGKRTTSPRPVVFKHGNLAKLRAEVAAIQRWESQAPGFTPRIWAFRAEDEENASLILEFLSGDTLQDLVVTGGEAQVRRALGRLLATMEEVWTLTRRPGPARAGFLEQLATRAEAVYRVHKGFAQPGGAIGDLRLPSLAQLLDQLRPLDRELAAPFATLLHGDCNLNNLIHDPGRDRIFFIDLHRSAFGDYVQDVSVFLVSNFRLPTFGPEARGRLALVTRSFLAWAREFARRNGDDSFEARLALGLARSFFTSTRFEFNQKFARQMFLRAQFLLGGLAAHRGRPWPEFRLPEPVLTY